MEVFKSFINHLCNCLTGMRIQTFRDNEELHVGEEIVPALTEAIDELSVPIPVDGGASSSSTASGSTYEVFLSFRGADTRLNFTDHLYNYLTDVNVQTFRDNEELRVGEEIGPDLMKAIKESSISIPIFSENYASSKWCLRELTHMVKCMNEKDPEGRRRHTVCPVFYNVTPEVVKRQTGMFAKAFLKHTKDKVDECTIQEWKDALTEVAELKGWEKNKIADGHEAKLVKIIVNKVCRKLRKSYVSLTDNLVGMDHHIDKMTQLLDINGDNGVRIVGIHGMGGIGKTTIAKSMYNQLCDHFQQQCSFLEDVREKVKRNDYAELRKQLVHGVLKREVDGNDIERSAFRNKKVLIVLDDVKDKSQLKEIIGGREYFGSGSRIIVTTRNKEVFEEWKGDIIYNPSGMNDVDSLLLFCNYAFESTQPQEGYEEISREVVETAAGLPLSLVVIGSMLFQKKIEKWEAALKKLKTIPADEVQKRLKISYDELSNNNKQMFLDIACHFIGEDITNAVYMWEDCGFHPDDCEGIDVLVSLSLITIQEKYRDVYFDKMEVDVFGMHDQLRDLGRDIVKQENPRIALERSRLVWSAKEAHDGGLKNQRGINKVETLHINYVYGDERYFNGFSNDDFKGMSKLRYLRLPEAANLEGDFNRLLPELRWFSWKGFTRLTAVTNFCPQNLVILDLSKSRGMSDGWEKQFQPLSNLKVLNLSGCSELTKTPDFSKFSNLERLILGICYKLIVIGSSVKHLKRLTYFNTTGCYRLRKLPPEFGSMTALQVFLGSNSNFSELPDSIGSLTQLQCLSLKYCSLLKKIPESFWNLQSLTELDISHTKIRKLSPEGIGKLEKLQVLNCSGTEVDTLPDDVRSLGNLRKLYLEGSKVKKLPRMGIERLQKLEELDCSRCKSLKEVPEGIWILSSLRLLDLNGTELTGALPKDISGMSRLETLDLGSCVKLRLPTQGLKLPISLTTLVLPFTKTALDSDSLRSLVNLRRLEFEGNDGCCCEPAVGVGDHHDNSSLEGEVPEGIWRLSSLRLLDLNGTKLTGALPKDISGMSRLETLDLGSCEKLRLPTQGLKLPISLTTLVLPFTKTALDSDSLRSLVNLRRLVFDGNAGCCCEPAAGVGDHHDNSNNNNDGTPLLPITIDMPSNLESLGLRGVCDHTKIKSCRLLPAMKFDSSSRLHNLEIEGFQDALLPGSIDLSNCQMLRELLINRCNKMREIAGFGNSLGSSWVLIDIRNCDSLEVLPNFSTLKGLKTLRIYNCPKLREIKGLEEVLTSLEELMIEFCDSLEVLPNFSTLKGLKTLTIEGCPKLREIKGLEVLTSLEIKGLEGLEGCPHLKKEELHPDVLNSETLRITFEQNEAPVETSDEEDGVETSDEEDGVATSDEELDTCREY